MADITIWGGSYTDAKGVDLPKTGGGTARFMDTSPTTATASDVAEGRYFFTANGTLTLGTATGGGGSVTQDQDGYIVLPSTGGGGGGDSWSWMGKNPAKIQEWTEHSSFADLGVGNWTYSTTQSTIRAYQSLSPTITCDVSQYGYIVVYKLLVSFDYGNWSPVSAYKKCSWVACGSLISSYSTANAVHTDAPNTSTTGNDINLAIAVYAGTAGTEAVSASTPSYAVFSSSIPSISRSGTYPNINTTWYKPTVFIRGNSSYFTETAFNNLDLSKSFYDLKIEVWRVDAETDNRGWQNAEAVNILNNGL